MSKRLSEEELRSRLSFLRQFLPDTTSKVSGHIAALDSQLAAAQERIREVERERDGLLNRRVRMWVNSCPDSEHKHMCKTTCTECAEKWRVRELQDALADTGKEQG